MNITDLKLKVKHTQPKRKEFDISFKVDGVALKGELTLMRDDGSIAKNKGKWSISAEIGDYIVPDFGVHRKGKNFGCGDCENCKTDLAPALLAAVKPLMEAEGMTLASGLSREDRGWYLFTHHIPNTGDYKTVGTRHCSPEVVAIYLEAPAKCPVHGKVKTQDTDVAD
jgi:hypothetical protein